MNRIFYLLLLFPFTTFAQTDSIFETSRLEKLVMQPGAFIHLQSDLIGETGNVYIGALAVNDLKNNKNNERQTAICFAPGGFNSPIFSPANLHIDGQEVDELIAALEKCKEIMADKNNNRQKVYQFTASNLVLVSFENRFSNPEKWDIIICRRYKYLNAKDANTCLSIKGKDLETLIHVARRFKKWETDTK